MNLNICKNYDLKNLNTFGVRAKADYFITVQSLPELKQAITFTKHHHLPFLILGGGSNMLFVKDFKGVVLKMNLQGRYVIKEDKDYVLVKVSAGENWHDLVLWSLDKHYFGLENLALIPGTVGAAPIQNIGAYGVEVKDVIDTVEVLDVTNNSVQLFTNEACDFSYRDSYFKKNKQRFVVLSVVFKFFKISQLPKIEYGIIKQLLADKGVVNPTPKDVADAIVEIRTQKLPDPKVLANAGSFFKNPVVNVETFNKIKQKETNIPFYKVNDLGGVEQYKIPAGWLIEQVGFKGFKDKDVGVHKKQALVLVNYGSASGQDILNLAKNIQDKVKYQFGITLDMEVNLIIS